VTEARRGLVHGITAYVLWGIVPAYWKLLREVSPVEVIAHRVVWGLVAFAVIVALAGVGPTVRAALRDPRTLAVMALSGTLLVINWGTFIAAVATGHLLDASLGYFINPLVSIALGMVVLGERLRPLQWLAIACAVAGVVIRTYLLGHAPWISLVLAASFGSYGLVRKLAKVDALVGSAVETTVVAPVAIAYLIVLAARGGGGLGHASVAIQLLLLSTGLVTALPLLLFNSAARRLPLSTVGFLQYLAPTGQFVLAQIYGEPFAPEQWLAFGLIWLGLAIFSLDLIRALSRTDR
jgi:chloramphenicol-sensitive protein RarD